MTNLIVHKVTFARQNEAFDKHSYDHAVNACALEHDISMLSDGDQTEIGEKGITLSGGQKVRVAMARAVYHDADICLLDDPLAAVDSHVAKHLFQKCIVDELFLRKSSNSNQKRTVVLVTNAVQYLSDPNVNKILVLDEGVISEVGTYSELSSKPDSKFSSFLSVMAETGAQDVAEDANVSSILPEEEIAAGEEPEEAISAREEPELERKASMRPDVASENTQSMATSATPLMTDEFKEREKGHVDLGVYLAWIKDAGGFFFGLALIGSMVLHQGVEYLAKVRMVSYTCR